MIYKTKYALANHHEESVMGKKVSIKVFILKPLKPSKSKTKYSPIE